MKLSSIPLILFSAVQALLAAKSGMRVDCSWLERHSLRYDTGTVHVVVFNASKKTFRLRDVKGIEALWFRAVPSAVAPGRAGEVIIKRRGKKPPAMPMKITLVGKSKRKLMAVVKTKNPPVFFEAVRFNAVRDRAYIYIKSKTPFTIKNFEIVSSRSGQKASTKILAHSGGKAACVITAFGKPLSQCDPVWVKANLENGTRLSTVVRAIGLFPLSSFTGDVSARFGLDAEPFYERYDKGTEIFKGVFQEKTAKGKAPLSAVMIQGDLGCQDRRRKCQVGGIGPDIIKRIRATENLTPQKPTFISVCEWKRIYAYFAYADIADIMMVNPYEVSSYTKKRWFNRYSGKPELNGYYTAIAHKAQRPRMLVTMPRSSSRHYVHKSVRFLTPEELRITVYTELIGGSRGFLYSRDRDFPNPPRLDNEKTALNKEMRSLKPFVQISENFPVLCTLNKPEKIQCATMLAGDMGVLIFLVNLNYQNFFHKPYHECFRYKKIDNLEIMIARPDYVRLKDKAYIMGAHAEPVENKGKSLKIRLERLDVTATLFLPTEKGLAALKANKHNRFEQMGKQKKGCFAGFFGFWARLFGGK